MNGMLGSQDGHFNTPQGHSSHAAIASLSTALKGKETMTHRFPLSLALCTLLCRAALPAPPPPPPPATQMQEQWPQSFNLRGFQVANYGFGVTQPGPIVLDVKSQGAPLDVVLQGPMPQPLEQKGAGNLRINYVVTPQNIQHGVVWHIMLRLAPDAAQAGGTSAGSIGVQHPPTNPQVMQQAVQAMLAQRHRPTDQERAQAAANVRAQRDALFNQRVAAGEQELAQRRATIFHNLQPAVDDMRRQKVAATTDSGQAATGLNTRSLAAPIQRLTPPNPVIASLSAAEGVPGDGIMINGSGFGTTDGEVHFIIGANPSIDLKSPPGVWVNNQIFTAVPDPSASDPSIGAAAYNGVVYVIVGGVKSNLVPFRFDPIIDHRLIRVPADYVLGNFADSGVVAWGGITYIDRESFNWISGASGDDQFFRHTLLQNGWTVESMPTVLIDPDYVGGGISLIIARVGTNSPFMDVFSWVDTKFVSWGEFAYYFEIPIKGPRGLPDGVVCPSKPPSGTACASSQ
jgi:hypothetical protein